MAIGLTAKPGDMTDVGLVYHMFSRTEDKDGVTGTALVGTLATDKSKIGDEIDLWAEHRYEGGFAAIVRLGYFMPGDALKYSTIGKDDKVMQVMVEGKMTF
jgi:hypothetical protein